MPDQKYFNRLFSLYAPAYPFISRLFNKSRKSQIEMVNSFSNTDDRDVLLIGGGDGSDIPLFSLQQKITYLDSSKGMFNRARQKFGCLPNLFFIFDDILSFYPNKYYDLVCLHFCLSSTSNPSQVVSKAVKLLKPGGVLSIMDVSRPNNGFWIKWTNFIWSRTISNFNLDIKRMSLNTECELVVEQPLQETKIYSSFIFKKNES